MHRRSRAAAGAALALLSGLAIVGGARAAAPDGRTTTAIKHVVVIVGENRSFDHLFATYVSPSGDGVMNLLSEGVVDADGKPGPNFAAVTQMRALDTTTYSISPTIVAPFVRLPAPNLAGTPSQQSKTRPPFTTLAIARRYDHGVPPADLATLTTGASGLPIDTIDTRIPHAGRLAPGPYRLSPGVGSDAYANSPVHRFYQMYQQLDCNKAYGTPANPSGCRADLFPWVEITVGQGADGQPRPPNFTDETTLEGATAMGFYDMQRGDAPYLKQLADQYTLLDNYHQPAMGGTAMNSLYLGYADALLFSDVRGNPATPPANQIENPDPQGKTNNWYTQDGYFGGSYSDCSDTGQPGIASPTAWLASLGVAPNCAPGAYYMLNNLIPGYYGDGSLVDRNTLVFTLPPSATASIGDVLDRHGVSWAYFGEDWTAYLADPQLFAPGAEYCNVCNPFQYETKIMTGLDPRTGIPLRVTHLKDATAFYDEVRNSELPAVSYLKPSGLNDGHPESSKVSIFESFVKKVVTAVQANKQLASNTAIFITVDEGGGYYDSGYVQPLDFFGDGTRIPMIIVSPFTAGGHVSHVYGDHASVVKFIEANWGLPPISPRSRDNLPNPVTGQNPYVPTNGPAISDLMAAFKF